MLDTFTEDRILSAVQELATEVSRVEAKVNAGGGSENYIVELTDITPVSLTSFHATASMLAGEIAEKIDEGKNVIVKIDLRSLENPVIFYVPIGAITFLDDNVYQAQGRHMFIQGGNILTEYSCLIEKEPIGTPEYSAILDITTLS